MKSNSNPRVSSFAVAQKQNKPVFPLSIVADSLPSVQVTKAAVGILGSSAGLNELLYRADHFARNNCPLLIFGETGVGKKSLANFVHHRSSRRQAKITHFNCATLSGELISSSLFGHAKGAFTGAYQAQSGIFAEANGGTLFLDEVGELPLEAQSMLLCVLEEGIYRRVGETKEVCTDVRIIAATNRDLRQMVAAGTFREDLYYRLDVLPLNVPPLRERRSDILPLVSEKLRCLNQEYGLGRRMPTDEDLNRVLIYSYPGNIRELFNIVERAYFSPGGERLCFPCELFGGGVSDRSASPFRTLEECQKEHIRRVVDFCDGKIAAAPFLPDILPSQKSTTRLMCSF
ncbi:MAG: sigma 54-interacting transcriptional regulator [Bacteroidota bacterium]